MHKKCKEAFDMLWLITGLPHCMCHNSRTVHMDFGQFGAERYFIRIFSGMRTFFAVRSVSLSSLSVEYCSGLSPWCTQTV